MNKEEKAILNWTYFMFNFPYKWEKKCFKEDDYIINKYKIIMEGHQTPTEGIMTFFSALSSYNQLKMINWVQENYLAFNELKIE